MSSIQLFPFFLSRLFARLLLLLYDVTHDAVMTCVGCAGQQRVSCLCTRVFVVVVVAAVHARVRCQVNKKT